MKRSLPGTARSPRISLFLTAILLGSAFLYANRLTASGLDVAPKDTQSDASYQIDPVLVFETEASVIDKILQYRQKLEPISQSNEEIIQAMDEFFKYNFTVIGPMILCPPPPDTDEEKKQKERLSGRKEGIHFRRFLMGSPKSEAGRKENELQHEVWISRPYWLGMFELTAPQYNLVMHLGIPSDSYKIPDIQKVLPAKTMTWAKAVEFCRRLNVVFQHRLPKGYEFGLPTEAQWEYACRSGTTTAYAGATLDSTGWHEDNVKLTKNEKSATGYTGYVGKLQPNLWGFYDMHGNVMEWCYDGFGKYGPFKKAYCPYRKKSIQVDMDPVYPCRDGRRSVRGGSTEIDELMSRSARREYFLANKQNKRLGFRLAIRPIINDKTGKFVGPNVFESEVELKKVVERNIKSCQNKNVEAYLNDIEGSLRKEEEKRIRSEFKTYDFKYKLLFFELLFDDGKTAKAKAVLERHKAKGPLLIDKRYNTIYTFKRSNGWKIFDMQIEGEERLFNKKLESVLRSIVARNLKACYSGNQKQFFNDYEDSQKDKTGKKMSALFSKQANSYKLVKVELLSFTNKTAEARVIYHTRAGQKAPFTHKSTFIYNFTRRRDGWKIVEVKTVSTEKINVDK